MADVEMFRRLILADDTVFNDCESGYSENNLWCYLTDVSFYEAFLYFSDINKVKTIKFEYGFDDHYTRITYSGIDEIKGIEKRESTIDVRLVGSNISVTTEKIILEPNTEEVVSGA